MLRQKKPTIAGVSARAVVMGTLLMVSWNELGNDASENLLASLLFGVVVLWIAVFAIPQLGRLQRRAHLHRELDALLASPAPGLPSLQGPLKPE